MDEAGVLIARLESLSLVGGKAFERVHDYKYFSSRMA